MKRFLVLLLTVGLLVSLVTGVAAAAKVTVGGEGNFGYNFAATGSDGDDGANFADLALTAKAEVDNFTLFGKFKNDYFVNSDVTKNKDTFVDEAYIAVNLNPVNLKIGYYGWGFGVNKDILDVTGDLKSRVGIQAEATLAEGLVGKLYLPTKGDKVVDDTYAEDGAFGLRLDYNQDVFGLGLIYGKKSDDLDAYTVSGYFKPVADLKTFLDYHTQSYNDNDDDRIIIGLLYTPADAPIEFRAEYDLDDEGNGADSFNPWGLRFAYKFNTNVKVEVNVNEKKDGVEEQSVKLNFCF